MTIFRYIRGYSMVFCSIHFLDSLNFQTRLQPSSFGPIRYSELKLIMCIFVLTWVKNITSREKKDLTEKKA